MLVCQLKCFQISNSKLFFRVILKSRHVSKSNFTCALFSGPQDTSSWYAEYCVVILHKHNKRLLLRVKPEQCQGLAILLKTQSPELYLWTALYFSLLLFSKLSSTRFSLYKCIYLRRENYAKITHTTTTLMFANWFYRHHKALPCSASVKRGATVEQITYVYKRSWRFPVHFTKLPQE